MKKILKFLIISIIVSCGGTEETKVEVKKSYATEGFWERVGTIQIVNGVNVDTIYWDDLELETRPRQVKAYAGSHFAWLSNAGVNQPLNEDHPWKTGAGAFGTYTFDAKSTNQDNMVESLTNNIGGSHLWGEGWQNLSKDNPLPIRFAATVTDKNYTQLAVRNVESDSIFGVDERTIGNTPEYAEYYEKIDETLATKIDGIWKHIANVRYINGVAVDTIGVPEGLDDHKIFHKGNVMVNFDFTKAKKGDSNWGGAGLSGKFTYKNNMLVETFNLSTGNWRAAGGVWPPTPYDIEWIDDDSFVQIWKVIAREGENGELEFVENESEETNGLLHVRVK